MLYEKGRYQENKRVSQIYLKTTTISSKKCLSALIQPSFLIYVYLLSHSFLFLCSWRPFTPEHKQYPCSINHLRSVCPWIAEGCRRKIKCGDWNHFKFMTWISKGHSRPLRVLQHLPSSFSSLFWRQWFQAFTFFQSPIPPSCHHF